MLYPSQNFICLGKGSKSTTNSVFNQFKHTLGKIKEYIHVWILTKLNICDSWKKNTLERLGGLSFETFAPGKILGRLDRYLEHKRRRTDLYCFVNINFNQRFWLSSLSLRVNNFEGSPLFDLCMLKINRSNLVHINYSNVEDWKPCQSREMGHQQVMLMYQLTHSCMHFSAWLAKYIFLSLSLCWCSREKGGHQ